MCVSYRVIIISQYQRTVEVRKELWRSPSSSLCSSMATYSLLPRSMFQTPFEYLQGEGFHNLTGQPGPVLSHPHSYKVSPHVQTEVLMFQFVPIFSCHRALLKTAWLYPLCTLPSGIYIP